MREGGERRTADVQDAGDDFSAGDAPQEGERGPERGEVLARDAEDEEVRRG